jgi:eukaryotic-like serine/threonine-protein kinase
VGTDDPPSPVETPTETLPVDGRAPVAPAAPEQPPGRDAGQLYVLLDRIGEGAMGVVHAAWDRELNRKVALKLVRPDRRQARGQARLVREAQAMAALRHENVVQVYDVGTLDDRVFVAMEFVEGASLRGWLASRPRRWPEVVRVFVAAGRGLRAAHAAGLVHRDFKPDNVLIGDDGVVRVADFGLAREADIVADDAGAAAQIPTAAAPTQTELAGTPAYMAPELLQGGRADARSDQFAFAVALYEAVHGRLPFPGDSLADILAAMGKPLAPPSRDLPAWLREAIARGLARAPGDRFPSMDALLAALDRDPAARRRRLTAAAGAAVALVAVAGTWWLARGPRAVCTGAERRLAGAWDDTVKGKIRAAFAATKLPFAADTARGVVEKLDAYGRLLVATTRDSCEATQLRREQSPEVMDLRATCVAQRLVELRALAGVLGRADETVVRSALGAAGTLSDAKTCDDVEALRRPVALPSDPAVRARAEQLQQKVAEGRALFEAGKRDRAREVLDEARKAAAQLGYAPVEAEALLHAAFAREETGYVWEPYFHQAIQRAEAGRHDEVKGWAAARLAWGVGVGRERIAEGRSWAQLALAAGERIGSARVQARAENALMALAQKEAKYEEAEAHGRKALALYEQADGKPEYGEAAIVWYTLASNANLRAQHDDAEPRFRKAAAIARRDFGPEHPLTLVYDAALPVIPESRGDFVEALRQWRSVADTLERVLGSQHWRTSTVRLNVAGAAIAAREADVALAAARTGLDDYVVAGAGEHSYGGLLRGAVARALLDLGRVAEATAEVKQALAILAKRPPEDQSAVMFTWGVLADAALAERRYRQAADAIARMHAVAKTSKLTANAELVQALCAGSELARATSQARRALEDAERALAMGERLWVAHSLGLVRPLLAIGEARLALGDGAGAIAPLERAMALLARNQIRPRAGAAERFALARALVAAGGDRRRARLLAEEARAAWAAGDAGGPTRQSPAVVVGWLAKNRI